MPKQRARKATVRSVMKAADIMAGKWSDLTSEINFCPKAEWLKSRLALLREVRLLARPRKANAKGAVR